MSRDDRYDPKHPRHRELMLLHAGQEEPERFPTPKEAPPDADELAEMDSEGFSRATDGCGGIEMDGNCEHGYPSWFVYLGLV
jgi:hypothetical protein